MYFYGFKVPEPATLALYIVLGVVVFLILFFLFRLINCWYFKINHRLREQQRTNELLEELSRKLDAIYSSRAPQQDPRYSYKDMYGKTPQGPGVSVPYQEPEQYGWQRPGTAPTYAAPAQSHSGQAAPKQEVDFSAEFAQDFMPAQPPVPPSVPGSDYIAPDSKQDTGDTLLMGSAGAPPAKPVNSGSDPGIPLDEIGDYGPAFCPSCHLPLTKDTVYCPNCGRKVR